MAILTIHLNYVAMKYTYIYIFATSPIEPTQSSETSNKSNRCVFNTDQLAILEESFQKENYPDAKTKEQVAVTVNAPYTKVSTWFQNRRAKSKKLSKEAELTQLKNLGDKVDQLKKSLLAASQMKAMEGAGLCIEPEDSFESSQSDEELQSMLLLEGQALLEQILTFKKISKTKAPPKPVNSVVFRNSRGTITRTPAPFQLKSLADAASTCFPIKQDGLDTTNI